METPELEFLLYMLERYLKFNSLDEESTTVKELIHSINVNLTPLGGG